MAKGKRKKMAQRDGAASKRPRLPQRQHQQPQREQDRAGETPAPQHRIEVLASDQRLDFLLEILSRPSEELLTTVVFAGTKAGCDRLHAALAAQPGSARWGVEVVHGNKRRDEQEASLRLFASGTCRCLLATETVVRKLASNAFNDGPEAAGTAAVDILVNYELPEDFFVRSAEEHQAFIRRIGNRGCTTFLRTDSFGDTDVKAAHSLVRLLPMRVSNC
jgi:superfamily II DNA/RNA helicase